MFALYDNQGILQTCSNPYPPPLGSLPGLRLGADGNRKRTQNPDLEHRVYTLDIILCLRPVRPWDFLYILHVTQAGFVGLLVDMSNRTPRENLSDLATHSECVLKHFK